MVRLSRNMKSDILERLVAALGKAVPPIKNAPSLSKRCKLPPSTARAYWNGSRTPSLEACESIGRSIGVRGHWIFYGEGEMEASEEPDSKPYDGLLFAAVEEAFLQARVSPEAAAEIAEVVQLYVTNLQVRPGTSPEEAIRRIMRVEIADVLRRKRWTPGPQNH